MNNKCLFCGKELKNADALVGQKSYCKCVEYKIFLAEEKLFKKFAKEDRDLNNKYEN